MRLQSFAGRWRLDRTIDDRRAGRTGRLAGEARFDPVDGGLAYVEDGTLAFPGSAPMQATRRYLWRSAGGGIVEVAFGDGGFFHRFDLGVPAPEATHDCPPDLYRVRYDFRAWPDWRAEWRVTGPSKDYGIVSAYARLDSAAPTEGARTDQVQVSR